MLPPATQSPGRGWLFVIAGVLWVSLVPCLKPADEAFPEYRLKAAFLYNFARFVNWPAAAFPKVDAPLTIGILGDDPFGPSLKETFEGKTVNGRRFSIKNLHRDDDLKGCHMLFISRSEKEHIPAILESLKGQSVLTVSETERFAQSGGMINLLVVSQSIRFEINLQAAEQAGLQVSSKLSGVGILVKPDKKK